MASGNLLSLPIKKSPDRGEALSTALRTWISEHSGSHPDDYASDLARLAQLRSKIIDSEPQSSMLDEFLTYQAQIAFLATRFPDNFGYAFIWSVSFPSHATSFPALPGGGFFTPNGAEPTYESRASIAYERGNVLLSLAGVHATLGCQEPRGDKESLKRCVFHFQRAAGILRHVRLHSRPPPAPVEPDKVANAQGPGQDFGLAILEASEVTMLAQAQECFWQQAVLDGLRNVSIAKVAAGVAHLYEAAWTVAQRSPGAAGDAGIFPAPMLAHLRVKTLHFRAASQYRKSKDDIGASRHGDELGRLHLAWKYVEQAQREVGRTKGPVGKVITSDLDSMAKALKADLGRSEKDNQLIYWQDPTGELDLPKIEAPIMVQHVVPDIVQFPLKALEGSWGPPLFSHLAPAGVEQAVDLYHDRVRGALGALERRAVALDAHATQALTELNLPASLDALDETSNESSHAVPATLVRAAIDANAQGGAEALYQAAQEVDSLTQTDQRVLAETENLLTTLLYSSIPPPVPDADAEADSQAAQELLEQCQAFRQAMDQAAASDALVQTKLDEWQPLLSVLLGGEMTMADYLPDPATASGWVQGQQRELARQLRALLEDGDEMAESRAATLRDAHARASTAPRTGHGSFRSLALAEAAKIQAANNLSMGHPPGAEAGVDRDRIEPAELEPLIQSQIKLNFGCFQSSLDEAGRALDRKLAKIKDVHGAFVQAMPSLEQGPSEREAALRQLHNAAAKYRELSANLAEGLHFYTEMGQSLVHMHNQAQQLHASHLARQQIYIQEAQASAAAEQKVPEVYSRTQPDSRSRQDDEQRALEAQAMAQVEEENRAQAELQEHMRQKQQEQQQAQAQRPPPKKWGAWSGGAIQFDD